MTMMKPILFVTVVSAIFASSVFAHSHRLRVSLTDDRAISRVEGSSGILRSSASEESSASDGVKVEDWSSSRLGNSAHFEGRWIQ